MRAAGEGATWTLALSSGDRQVFVVQRDNGDICVVDQTSGVKALACAHAAAAEDGGVGIFDFAPTGARRLTLLVPDGVDGVSFARADGGSVTVPVRNNAVQYASVALTAASYRLPDGRMMHDVVPQPPQP